MFKITSVSQNRMMRFVDLQVVFFILNHIAKEYSVLLVIRWLTIINTCSQNSLCFRFLYNRVSLIFNGWSINFKFYDLFRLIFGSWWMSYKLNFVFDEFVAFRFNFDVYNLFLLVVACICSTFVIRYNHFINCLEVRWWLVGKNFRVTIFLYIDPLRFSYLIKLLQIV